MLTRNEILLNLWFSLCNCPCTFRAQTRNEMLTSTSFLVWALEVHEPLHKFKYKVKVISFLVSISFLVWALKVHEPYISHQIAEVTFLAAYIPLGYKLLYLQWPGGSGSAAWRFDPFFGYFQTIFYILAKLFFALKFKIWVLQHPNNMHKKFHKVLITG